MNKKVILLSSFGAIVLIIILTIMLSSQRRITIYFETMGGTNIEPIKIKDGKSLQLPFTEKDLHYFGGWYYDDVKVNNKTIFHEDTTLVAKWIPFEKNVYRISFDTQGGTSIESINFEEGELLVLPSNPTKKGYTFISWVDQNNNVINSGFKIYNDLQLIAKWEKNKSTSSSNENVSNDKQPEKHDSRKDNYLSFADVFFENNLKNQLNIGGTTKISEYDMLQLKSLSIKDSVTNIEGIKYAKNLTELTIDSKIVGGLSELSSISSLKSIELQMDADVDISFLNDIKTLTSFRFGNPHANGQDRSVICNGKSLKSLFYYSPHENGIEFLSNCTSLEELELWHAFLPTDDISVLLSLPKLKKVEILTYNDFSQEQLNVIEELIKKGVSYKKM